MIDRKQVIELVNKRIGGSALFMVDVTIGNSNEIRVLIDSQEGVSIEECVDISRWMNGELDKIDENFSLEVSSPGLGSPLLIRQQYVKNIGREVEVVLKDGKKKKGKLLEVSEEGISLETVEKKIGGGSQKKKKPVKVNRSFAFDEIKSTKVVISF
ncbi:MAG: ribosome assembly cofactor RimP [Bacteroidales bacterium]|nr:ribosome assembly cofactor RimP [Bacteroidales bacterium]